MKKEVLFIIAAVGLLLVFLFGTLIYRSGKATRPRNWPSAIARILCECTHRRSAGTMLRS